MIIEDKSIESQSLNWVLRCSTKYDADELSKLRVKIDGETENLNREAGEGLLINNRIHKDGKHYNTVIMGRILGKQTL